MRRISTLIIVPLAVFGAVSCGKDGPKNDSIPYNGLVINEIAAHDELSDIPSWVEIVNTSDTELSLEGAGLYLTDQYFNNRCIWEGTSTLGPGARLVVSTKDEMLTTGICSNDDFTLRLGTKDNSADSFTRNTDCPEALFNRGSYQRIPDASGEWRRMPYSSKNQVNEVFEYKKELPNAIWMWSSHMEPMLADDAAVLKEYYRLGYRHLLLNSAAFTTREKEVGPFLDRAEEIGFIIHGWIQAFYAGGKWNVPIDKETKQIKEEVYTALRELGTLCIEKYGVKGLHLDYIRWPNNASNYNFTKEVNSVAAVTRACREIRELCDGYGAGLVTSAALMPEKNSTNVYAQDPSQMGKWLHLLMPMCYRYSYGYSDAGVVDVMNWFCKNSADAEVWSGIQTYDKNTQPLSSEKILEDAKLYASTNSTGIVLFRYGLGTFPDLNNLWNNQ